MSASRRSSPSERNASAAASRSSAAGLSPVRSQRSRMESKPSPRVSSMRLPSSSENPLICRKPSRSARLECTAAFISAWRACSRCARLRHPPPACNPRCDALMSGARISTPCSARVAHDLRRGVKAHRLRIEQSGREHVRVAAFHPGRGIDQIGEARGMAFRKSVIAEALDLVEAALREIALIAARDHAFDEFRLERMDGADALERRHGAAEAVGLPGLEARRHDRDAHGLFLEQRNAQCLAQHLAQFIRIAAARRGIAHQRRIFAPLQIRMHHLALDRARAARSRPRSPDRKTSPA